MEGKSLNKQEQGTATSVVVKSSVNEVVLAATTTTMSIDKTVQIYNDSSLKLWVLTEDGYSGGDIITLSFIKSREGSTFLGETVEITTEAVSAGAAKSMEISTSENEVAEYDEVKITGDLNGVNGKTVVLLGKQTLL